jgi:hypothetical protein
MTNTQHDLVAALVSAIMIDLVAPPMTALDANGEPITCGRSLAGWKAGAVYAWFPASPFEGAVWAVDPFGVIQLNPNGQMDFQLLVSLNEVEAHTRNNMPTRPVDLSRLIEAFLSLSCLQLGSLPSTRQWFTPRAEYMSLMQHFAHCGYAGQLNGQFRWTDKIGQAMLEACQWNPAFENLADLEDLALERMWNTMPASAKQRYFFGDFNMAAANQYVSQCWDGEVWICDQFDKPTEEWWKLGQAEAVRLYERFVAPFK